MFTIANCTWSQCSECVILSKLQLHGPLHEYDVVVMSLSAAYLSQCQVNSIPAVVHTSVILCSHSTTSPIRIHSWGGCISCTCSFIHHSRDMCSCVVYKGVRYCNVSFHVFLPTMSNILSNRTIQWS